jgi:ABC-type phosphonate transport system ATPase subunit
MAVRSVDMALSGMSLCLAEIIKRQDRIDDRIAQFDGAVDVRLTLAHNTLLSIHKTVAVLFPVDTPPDNTPPPAGFGGAE